MGSEYVENSRAHRVIYRHPRPYLIYYYMSLAIMAAFIMSIQLKSLVSWMSFHL